MKLNVIFSILGVALTTLFPIIVFPYISRTLGVDEMGKYNYYNSIITYLSFLSNFGISIYGVREIGKYRNNLKLKNKKAAELIYLNIITTIVCYLLIIPWIINIDQESRLIIIVLSLVLITNAFGAEWYFVGIEKQRDLLLRNIIIKIISLFLIFFFVKNKSDLLIYIIIITFSSAAVSILNIISLRKIFKHASVNLNIIKKYAPVLLLIFLIEIEVRYFGLVDTVILGFIKGDNAVGIYSIALKVFLLSCSFLKITSLALLPKASYYINNKLINEFYDFLNKTIDFLFLIGLPASVIIYLEADQIILLLGGIEFISAVPLMKLFSTLILPSVLINTLVFQVLYPFNKIKSILFSFIIGIIINLVINLYLVPEYTYYGTFFASFISHLAIFFFIMIKEKEIVHTKIFSTSLLKYFYAAFIFIVVSLSTRTIIKSEYNIIPNIISGIAYILALYMLNDKFIKYSCNLIVDKIKKR